MVLLLDDNQVASVGMQSNSFEDVEGSSKVDVVSHNPTYESEDRSGDVTTHKRVRFEE